MLVQQDTSTGQRLAIGFPSNLQRQNASQVCPRLACSGKSAATFTTKAILKGKAELYTSITLASLHRRSEDFSDFAGHIIVDDLGSEKSIWSRTATITVLANLVHTHYVRKETLSYVIDIAGFSGSASLNIQPVLMNSLVQGEDWIAVVRDKVLRYYHLFRPLDPKAKLPRVNIKWGKPYTKVQTPTSKGLLFWQLMSIGLMQWSAARCLEHIPALLRGCAALDGRLKVKAMDYKLLIKLLKPIQLERYIISTYGFETGRSFQNDVYCLLVEMATHKPLTIERICDDYKVSPTTVERIVKETSVWCWIKANSPKKVMPTDQTKNVFDIIGVHEKW